MRVVTASLIGLLVATPLLGQEPEQQDRDHVVRRGDTLWDLAGFYLQNPFRWPLIYQANTSVVEDPHWIYPREVLRIPGLTLAMDAARRDRMPVAAVQMTQPMDRPLRSVFYREPVQPPTDRPTLLSEPDRTPVPVRPGEFVSAEFIADPADLLVYGRTIRPVREVSTVGGIPTSAHPQDEIYVGYRTRDLPRVGERLLVVAPGRRIYGELSSPRIIHPTAVVEVLELSTEVMIARVIDQFGAVHPDQLVIPLDMYPDFRGMVAEPVESPDIAGRMIGFADEQPIYRITDRAFIDLGREHGVQVGDVFTAILPERAARRREPGEFTTRIETVPPSHVAELRVLRVNERDATVVVDKLFFPQLEAGLRVERIRKMP
jgi:hypothetical protein